MATTAIVNLDCARVLVYDPDLSKGLVVASHIQRSAAAATVTVLSAPGACLDVDGEPFDVSLINLAASRLDGLGAGAELSTRFPWIQTVFWFDENGGASAAEAARSFGINRLIPFAALVDWLDRALSHLVRIARARREQIDAERALPSLPNGRCNDDALPLLEAERRFREAYLRRTISESKNHAAAARKAGLAYTTFCSMLRKMNVP